MALNGNLPLPKSTAIVHATPTNARPTHSVWNHEHDRVSDFVPIASLLEWQWHRIVMRNGQFYHSSRNRASRTAQCREIPSLGVARLRNPTLVPRAILPSAASAGG